MLDIQTPFGKGSTKDDILRTDAQMRNGFQVTIWPDGKIPYEIHGSLQGKWHVINSSVGCPGRMCLWHTHRRDSGSVRPKCSQGSRKDGQNHFGHGGNSFADVNAVEVPNQPF